MWHYQIKKTVGEPNETFFEIVEVYTNPTGWTDGIYPIGNTPEELIRELERMLADARKYPVLGVPE
ncbi:MAG: hypothetical protein ACRCZI_13615 [Cetobacterium sp.]